MSRDKFQGLSKKELAELARQKGIADAANMPKDQLLKALNGAPNGKVAKKKAAGPAKVAKGAKVAAKSPSRSPAKSPARVRPQLTAARNTNGSASAEEQVENSKYDVGIPTKDLSARVPKDLPAGYGKDRIVVMVRDPYWLHAYWELTHTAVQRAEAALGQEWHGAKPILRVLDVGSHDTTSHTESVVKDIDIHGGVSNWYLDVSDPPRSFRVDIGYLAKNGQFYVLARSNVVSTPRAGVSDVIDENWADIDAKKADRIYAMSGGFDPSASSLELKQLFEERLRRPMGSPAVTSFGSGALMYGKQRKFWFQLDAELIVYGATEPSARVTLQGEPVKLRPDGTFTMRFSLPDSRQIIPAVAASADGIEERTIVLAVERNTKQLEPLIHESE
ncbi:MAG: DUF4912 domain-containing protein [Planctomycetes bacterium]|nr:DUF4912 domain-containing protein [Planctomycetota bacterium]